MSFVIAAPEILASAATDLNCIASALSEANTAAASSTTSVLAAGADEVSAAIAALFGGHAQAYQTIGAQASAFHAQFVQAITAGAGAYAGAEAPQRRRGSRWRTSSMRPPRRCWAAR